MVSLCLTCGTVFAEAHWHFLAAGCWPTCSGYRRKGLVSSLFPSNTILEGGPPGELPALATEAENRLAGFIDQKSGVIHFEGLAWEVTDLRQIPSAFSVGQVADLRLVSLHEARSRGQARLSAGNWPIGFSSAGRSFVTTTPGGCSIVSCTLGAKHDATWGMFSRCGKQCRRRGTASFAPTCSAKKMSERHQGKTTICRISVLPDSPLATNLALCSSSSSPFG